MSPENLENAGNFEYWGMILVTYKKKCNKQMTKLRVEFCIQFCKRTIPFKLKGVLMLVSLFWKHDAGVFLGISNTKKDWTRAFYKSFY